jgi:hypothetical protein
MFVNFIKTIAMSRYQQEWKQMLQKSEAFEDWKIRKSGGDLLIRVPEETDMDLLKIQFSDTIASIAPLIKSPKTTLKFYVGNSDEADFIFTLN